MKIISLQNTKHDAVNVPFEEFQEIKLEYTLKDTWNITVRSITT